MLATQKEITYCHQSASPSPSNASHAQQIEQVLLILQPHLHAAFTGQHTVVGFVKYSFPDLLSQYSPKQTSSASARAASPHLLGGQDHRVSILPIKRPRGHHEADEYCRANKVADP
jgi:hypothetical protein